MTGLMRKHGKWLLAIFSSMLMIIFILPNIRGGNAAPGAYVIGKLNGTKVAVRELDVAKFDIQVLSHFVFEKEDASGFKIPVSLMEALVVGKQLETPYGRFRVIDPRVPLTPLSSLQPTHWYLLLEEARQFRLTVSPEEIDDIIAQTKLSQADIDSELTGLHTTERGLRQAIGDARLLDKLSELVMNSTTVSLPEVEYLANLGLSKIDIAFAAVNGQKDWEKAPAPTEEQIKKQFELYKNVVATPQAATAEQAENLPTPPTIDGHTYPFGYTYPDRVKVEYLRFDKSQLKTKFQATSEDYDAAYAYYTAHPDEFKNSGDETPPASSQPATSTKPAASTQPAINPFTQVQAELVQRQVDLRVSKLLRKAADRALTLAADPWKNAESNGGFLNVIPQDKWADYQKIAGAIAANPEYAGFHPEYNSTVWLSAEQLGKLPGIGEAYMDVKPRPFPFPVLATHVKELVGPKDPVAGRFFLEVGLEPGGTGLKDAAGNFYIYRVVAAEKSHPPANIEEVRPQVVEDLKKIATYEQAQAKARELANEARAGDLLGLAKSRNIPADTANGLTQATPTVGQLGHVPGLVEAAFAMTHEPAATQPVQNGHRVSATTTLARDPTLKVYVLELLSYMPTTAEDFNAQRRGLVQEFQSESRRNFMAQWLDLTATAARLHYVPTQAFDSKTDEGD